MRRQSTNLLSRRAELKKSAYMLAAVFFCIVGVVFAWFTFSKDVKIDTLTMSLAGNPLSAATYYAAETVSFYSDESSDDAATVSADASEPSDGIEILSVEDDGTLDDTDESSYVKEILSYYKSLEGEDAYQVIGVESGFSATVNPGQGIVFRTVVSNSALTDKSVSLYLTGTSYSKSLQDAVRIGVLQAAGGGTTEVMEIEVPDDLVKEKKEGNDTLCYLESVQLVKDVTIPAGNETSPGTATIDWYIWLDGSEVESTCQNANLTIGQLQMVTEE
jgi:hypothetical protein